MSAKISWQLEINGTDKAISDLIKIDRLLSSISRHKGGTFLGGGSNQSRGPDGRFIPNVPISSQGLASTAGASALGSSIGVSSKLSKGLKDSAEHLQKMQKIWETAILISPGGRPFSSAAAAQGPEIHVPGAGIFNKPYEGPVPPKLSQFTNIIGQFTKSIDSSIIRFISITAIVTALHKAFELLKEGVQHAAESYQQAAKLGQGVGITSLFTNAMKSIGIDEQMTEHMALIAQLKPQDRQMSVPGMGSQFIGAARLSQFGATQQLENMSKEFIAAMNDGVISAVAMEQSAKAGMELSMKGTAVMREFKTMLSEIVALFSPMLNALSEVLINFMKRINILLLILIEIGQRLHLISKGSPGDTKLGSIGSIPNVTGWEKIGFSFGQGSTEKLTEIAKNTKESATTLGIIAEFFKSTSPNTTFSPQFFP